MSFNFKNADLSLLAGHQSPSLRSRPLPSNPFPGELLLLEPSISQIRQDSARKRGKPERVSPAFAAEHEVSSREQDARGQTGQPNRLTLAHYPRKPGRQPVVNVREQLSSAEVGLDTIPPSEEAADAPSQVDVMNIAAAFAGGGPVEYSDAIGYVTKVRNRFAQHPDIYMRFLEILKS